MATTYSYASLVFLWLLMAGLIVFLFFWCNGKLGKNGKRGRYGPTGATSTTPNFVGREYAFYSGGSIAGGATALMTFTNRAASPFGPTSEWTNTGNQYFTPPQAGRYLINIQTPVTAGVATGMDVAVIPYITGVEQLSALAEITVKNAQVSDNYPINSSLIAEFAATDYLYFIIDNRGTASVGLFGNLANGPSFSAIGVGT
jgi:hypothetical protein